MTSTTGHGMVTFTIIFFLVLFAIFFALVSFFYARRQSDGFSDEQRRYSN
ncbi:MAG TPA: hypothetical protein VK051_02415 [Paenalcaligenes sp.]|nr:hypothetical protein [Paenalcaligenes sp.]